MANHQIVVSRKAQRAPSLRAINTGALGLACLWFAVIVYKMSPLTDDFSFHWRAAGRLLGLGDPYAGQSALDLERQPYMYPPLFPFLVQPFALLSQSQAQWIWFGFNTLLLGLLVWLCIAVSGSRLARRYWGVVVLGALLWPPARISLQLGQVSIMLALLVIGSYVLARRHAAVAGLCLAAATLIKLFPGLLVLYFVLRRSWRVLWWSCIAGVLLLLLPLPFYGVEPYMGFMRMLLVDGQYPYAAEFNVSIQGFAERLFTKNLYVVPFADLPGVARGMTVVLAVVVLGLCFWAGWGPSDQFGKLLRFNPWLIGMMLLVPSNGYYNLVFLLLPFLTLLRYIERFRERDVRYWLILATVLAWVPTTWSDGYDRLYAMTHARWGLLILTPPVYGLMVYLVLLAVVARRYQAHHAQALTMVTPTSPNGEGLLGSSGLASSRQNQHSTPIASGSKTGSAAPDRL